MSLYENIKSNLKESKVTEEEYICNSCGLAFNADELTAIDDDGNDLCPACGSSDITDTGSDEDFDESQKLNESDRQDTPAEIMCGFLTDLFMNENADFRSSEESLYDWCEGGDAFRNAGFDEELCKILDNILLQIFGYVDNINFVLEHYDNRDGDGTHLKESGSVLNEREVEKSWSDDGKSLNIRELVARLVESDETHDFGELSEKEIDYLFDALLDGPEFHDGLYELIKRIVIPIAEKMRSKDKLNESAKDDELYQLICKRLEDDFKEFKKANPGKSNYFFEHNYDGSAIVDEFNKDYGTNFSFTIKFDPWQIPYPSVNIIDDDSISKIYNEVMSNGSSKSPNGNGLSLRGSYICRSNPYDMADDDCRPYNANNSNMADFKKWLNEIDSVPSRIDRS